MSQEGGSGATGGSANWCCPTAWTGLALGWHLAESSALSPQSKGYRSGWWRADRSVADPSSVDAPQPKAYVADMKPALDPREKIAESDTSFEQGHAAWKRAKVERGLAQAKDRKAMIPVERILRDFKLDG